MKSDDKATTKGLDFYLPGFGVFVECKQFHTLRIAEQTGRVKDVIVIQGAAAADAFVAMLGTVKQTGNI